MIFSVDSSMHCSVISDLKPDIQVIQQFIQVSLPLNMSLKILFQLNQICQFLKEVHQIDSAIEKIEKEITLIEEYQTSLIYQAVTGKISIS